MFSLHVKSALKCQNLVLLAHPFLGRLIWRGPSLEMQSGGITFLAARIDFQRFYSNGSLCIFGSNSKGEKPLSARRLPPHPEQLASQGNLPADSPKGAIKQSATVISRLSFAGVGFNEKGKKTLAHPDYQLIQSMWHPTKNLGKVPADITHGCAQKVWLRCPDCIHRCGRHHEWEARIDI